MKFPELLLAISIELVRNEKFLETFENLKIQTSDWPEGKLKSMVEMYLDTRQKINHDMAQHSVAELFAELKPLMNFDHPEMIEGLLEPIYFDLQQKFRIEKLARALIEDPGRGDELISGYQNNLREVTEVQSMLDAVEKYLPQLWILPKLLAQNWHSPKSALQVVDSKGPKIYSRQTPSSWDNLDVFEI